MLLPFFTQYPLLENHLPSSIQMKSHQGVARKLAIKISQDVLDWKWHVCEPANIPKLEAWDAMHLRISFAPTSAMHCSFDSRVCSPSGGNTMQHHGHLPSPQEALRLGLLYHVMCGGSLDLQQFDAACLKNMAKNTRNYFNLSDPQHGV